MINGLLKQTTLQLEEISTDKTKLEQEVRGLLKTLSADKFTKQKSEQAIKVGRIIQMIISNATRNLTILKDRYW